MERSHSMHFQGSRANDWVDATQQYRTRRKYSLEALFKPGRTNLSSKIPSPLHPPVPQPIDFLIAQSLLHPNSILLPQIPPPRGSSLTTAASRMSQFTTKQSSSHVPHFCPQPYDGPQDSTEESLSSSTMNEPSTQRFFSSSATSQREIPEFVKQYDSLALRYGLMRLDAANLTEVPSQTLSITPS